MLRASVVQVVFCVNAKMSLLQQQCKEGRSFALATAENDFDEFRSRSAGGRSKFMPFVWSNTKVSGELVCKLSRCWSSEN